MAAGWGWLTVVSRRQGLSRRILPYAPSGGDPVGRLFRSASPTAMLPAGTGTGRCRPEGDGSMTNAHGPWVPPYPAAPPTPPAPRRRRSRWLTVGLPLGVLALVGVVLAVWTGIGALRSALGPAQQAARDYATALVDGRWDDAQGQLCARDRAEVTPAALAQRYSSPDLTGYRLERTDVVSSNGTTSGEARLVFTTASGPGSTTVLPLEEDGGTWHPCP